MDQDTGSEVDRWDYNVIGQLLKNLKVGRTEKETKKKKNVLSK